MLRFAILTAAMLAPTAAFAQGSDGGPAPSRCGTDLSDEGGCYGSVLAWCQEPNVGGSFADAGVTTVDCARLSLDDEDLPGSCASSGSGAFCGVPAGAACALPGDDGVVQLACLSGSALDDGAACDLDEGCVPGAACSDDARACEGDRLRLACADFGQALVIDCAALGGSCVNDACSGIEQGGRCGAGLQCAEGLSCIGAEGGLGSCLPEGAPVSPVEPPEEDPPPPPASCSAAHGSRPSPAVAGWLALLGLLALLRTSWSKRSNIRYRRVHTR